MPLDGKVFAEEHNVISLRIAYVMEVDGVVGLSLSQAKLPYMQDPKTSKIELEHWLNACHVHMYQRAPSGSKMPIWGLRHLTFDVPPQFKLVWADSGNSVAVCLNGEPWAFIDEHTQAAYSKGVLKDAEMNPWYRDYVKAAKVGNPWNQETFEKTFADAFDGH